MSDTVIKVENLSKSYQIRHQSGERYTALRDVVSNGVKGMGNRLLGRTNGHVDTSREEFWALNDVSFEVKQGAPQGHPVGIIGRNGARPGGSRPTLLKILSRKPEPTKGRVASLLEVAGARLWARFSSRVDGTRKCLPKRRHPRHEPRRNSSQV